MSILNNMSFRFKTTLKDFFLVNMWHTLGRHKHTHKNRFSHHLVEKNKQETIFKKLVIEVVKHSEKRRN